MKLKLLVTAACLALCSACSVVGSGGSSGGPPASAAECRAIAEKGLELQGIPVSAMGEIVEATVQKCVSEGKVTKGDYQCVMAATSADASRACNVNL